MTFSLGHLISQVPVVGGAAGSVYGAVTGAAGDVGSTAEDLGNDYMNGGRNRTQVQNFGMPNIQYGGQYGADNLAEYGLNHAAGAAGQSNYFMGQARTQRGPVAMENQDLSNRESEARYGDQNGAIQLSREAAMGQAPSEAAYMMQQGLDRGLANQQALAGGARGMAGLAMAGSNAAANSGALQNQAFTAAGQMRAGEMAQARGQYGQLAQGQREQDLGRLNMGNQMGQFNATNNNQYQLGMGGLSNQANQNAQGWYGQSMQPYNQQQQGQIAGAQIGSQNFNEAQATQAGINQANTDARTANRNNLFNFAGSAAGPIIQKGIGGSSVPPPKG